MFHRRSGQNRRQGGSEGLGRSAWIGAAIGAVLGASTVAFYMAGLLGGAQHWTPPALFTVAFSGVIGGVVGLGIGLMISALISRKREPTCLMAVEHELPGWGFWGRWVLVSAVGFGLGAFLGMSLAWATVGVVATGSEVTPTFFSMAYFDAMFVGTEEQWHDLKYAAFYAPGGEFIYWAVTIALGGLMQWLVLRRHIGWARWWALPVPLAVAYHGLTADNPLTAVGGGVTLIAFYAKDFGIGGALYGMIVGIPLVWLLRRSYRKAKRDGNAFGRRT